MNPSKKKKEKSDEKKIWSGKNKRTRVDYRVD